MTGNPTNQKFYVGIKSSIPSTINSKDDAINFLNSAGSTVWNDAMQGVYDVSFYTTHGFSQVTSVTFSNSKWIDYEGYATLTFYMNTTSDPLTTEQVNESLLLGISLLAISIGAVLLLIPIGGWAVDLVGAILALAGILTLTIAFVQEVGTVLPSPTTVGGMIFYGSLIAIAVGGTAAIVLISRKH